MDTATRTAHHPAPGEAHAVDLEDSLGSASSEPATCVCGKPVAPGRKKYCSDDCMWNASHVRRPLVPREGTRLIYELRAEVPAGLCIYCERRTSNRLTCHRQPCRTAYNTDYQSAKRAAARAATSPQVFEERLCDCGCGTPYTPARLGHRFASKKCGSQWWEKTHPRRER